MSEQYKVVNPTSLFIGRIGNKVDSENAKETMLVFDGPRGDIHAMFHPSEIKKVEIKEAWVLRLKVESKDSDMIGEYYFCDGESESDIPWMTDNLQEATIYSDKEKEVEAMKEHERIMIELYGDNAIMNYGYTNMMKHFEWVEVELEEVA